MTGTDDEGVPVDPRFLLANERTFLAWIRTALALVATGVAIEALALPIYPAMRVAGAVVFTVLGAIAAIQAWLGWRVSDRALRRGDPLPTPVVGAWITAGVVGGVGLLGLGALL